MSSFSVFLPFRALLTVATEEVLFRPGKELGPLLTTPLESMVRLAQHQSLCHRHWCVRACVCVWAWMGDRQK